MFCEAGDRIRIFHGKTSYLIAYSLAIVENPCRYDAEKRVNDSIVTNRTIKVVLNEGKYQICCEEDHVYEDQEKTKTF
jgi:hypothetical protein